MKRLSVVMIAVIVLSTLLAACGGGVASDPVGVAKAAMQAVVDEKFDQLAELTCAAQKDKVKQSFNLAGAFGASGVDAAKILDTMTISFQNPEYAKVSEEGDKAVVQIKGKMLIKFDREKLKPILKEVLKARGQQNTEDDVLNVQLDMIEIQSAQGQDMDEKVNIVKENGKWAFCP
jgi:hypothetical protein